MKETPDSPGRIVIYPKDVHLYTGLSPRCCRERIANLKKLLGKNRSSHITIEEYCDFYSIDVETIRKFILGTRGFAPNLQRPTKR